MRLPTHLRAEYAALYVTIAAFSGVTLISAPGMFPSGRWLPYVIGVALFTLIADRSSHAEDWPLPKSVLTLIVMGALLVALSLLAELYFLTSMLSFINVSVAEAVLTPRRAVAHHVVLLIVLALAFGAVGGPEAALQVGLGLSAGFLFIAAFLRLAQRESDAREKLEAANRQLTEYAAQVEQLATMRERNRLAREVHDSLGHYLTVINVQLEVVTKLLESNPLKALEAAKRAKELASEGLSEVRRSVAALRPSPLDDRPLVEAMQGLIDTAREAGLMVELEQSGPARALSPEVETVIYRAAQEALTNIRKHAHASSARVRLTYTPTEVQLAVRDNGVGRRHDEDSVGLTALRERAAALNGTVLTGNHPDGGFQIEVKLPT